MFLLACALLATPTPLPNAHAHNDYYHPRPLHDALDHGFCSVEADVFLKDGKLLVGHFSWELKAGRDLETLYLKPLRERVQAQAGRVYRDGPPFYLLIDLKTDGATTYNALHPLFERYADILSTTRDGKHEAKAVTVVISGNCPREAIIAQKVRYAGIDGRLSDLDADHPTDLLPWISASWGSVFKWRGEGEMPKAEADRLREIVMKAHAKKRLVRFWAAPQTGDGWRALRRADVDLLNADDLAKLRDFLAPAR